MFKSCWCSMAQVKTILCTLYIPTDQWNKAKIVQQIYQFLTTRQLNMIKSHNKSHKLLINAFHIITSATINSLSNAICDSLPIAISDHLSLPTFCEFPIQVAFCGRCEDLFHQFHVIHEGDEGSEEGEANLMPMLACCNLKHTSRALTWSSAKPLIIVFYI